MVPLQPNPNNSGSLTEYEIIGGVAGGVVVFGAISLFIYGKSSGWWCSGEHHGGAYTAINGEA